ncbi:MAG: OmpA family protein [Acidobacteria bacterium]|nr:OmpA family protein [Acidobacteriota bacterium]
MAKKWIALFFVLALTAFWCLGMDKNDFEEINFALDSDVLVDGFPSMLRLADIMANYPEYVLLIEGHCDSTGSEAYNDKLAMKRVDAVKNFLIKYGARPEQVEVAAQGEKAPMADNATLEGRWQNRRVVFTLYKMVDGRKVEIKADAPIADILRELAKYPIQDKLDALANKQDAILEKLAKLDDLGLITTKLTEMEEEIAALKDKVRAMEEAPAQVAEVETAPQPEALEPKVEGLSLLGFDMGVDDDGDFTMNVSGRYFHRFTPTTALQAGAEYLRYHPDRDEFQFDLGLVKRWGMFQMGAFGSMKRVKMFPFDDPGVLAQGAVMAELIFENVSIGGFATHAMIREDVVHREVVSINRIRETYLNTLDQYGATFQFGLPKDFLVEGNVGFINRGPEFDTKVGGVVRLVGPISESWAWFVEGGWNETYITDDDTGRFAAGIRFGKWKSPKTAADSQAVPMDVPRLRYDVRTRIVRTNNEPPVADAGPDLIMVDEGIITLDGTGSYDPEGDEITYQWTQILGPTVDLTGATTPTPSFYGEQGQTYVFRLTVTDSYGDIGTDDVRVVIKEMPPPEILFFVAEPMVVSLGQQSHLSWKVLHADELRIEANGMVYNNLERPEGHINVVPTVTTAYTIVATGTEVVTQTITVEVSNVDIQFFRADPSVIALGEQTQLSWNVLNAESVTISGIGSVDAAGSVMVSPTTTTEYVLTATDASSATVTATATVTVAAVDIQFFRADPSVIALGEQAELSWSVLNAETVEISGIGAVNAAGSTMVSPTTTTEYVLTATDAAGTTKTATITVTVSAVDIQYFRADPSVIARGDEAQLSWSVLNAETVEISGIGVVDAAGSVMVSPNDTTAYVLTATDANGSTVTSTITVTVQTVSIVYFDAEPAMIQQGGIATLTWLAANAEEVELDGVAVDAHGSMDVNPTQTTTYTLVARAAGVEVNAQVIVEVAGPEVLFFVANPDTIGPSETAMLSWKVANALSVEIDNGVGTVDADGSVPVNPAVTTTYTLTATGGAGAVVTAQVVVSVVYDVQVLFFHADPSELILGESTTLSWGVANATSISIEGGGDTWEFTDPATSSLTVTPAATTTYTLTATRDVDGVVDTATAQVVVTVIPANKPPVAFAGLDRVLSSVGNIQLNGTGSFDPDGPYEELTFFWQIVNNPEGAGTLSDPTSDQPVLSAPIKGTYVIRLVVTDKNGEGLSDQDEVIVRIF